MKLILFSLSPLSATQKIATIAGHLVADSREIRSSSQEQVSFSKIIEENAADMRDSVFQLVDMLIELKGEKVAPAEHKVLTATIMASTVPKALEAFKLQSSFNLVIQPTLERVKTAVAIKNLSRDEKRALGIVS